MIEEALQDWLVADTDVAALIVHNNSEGTSWDHMFPVFAHEDAAAPFIAYRLDSTEQGSTHDGPDGHSTVTFVLACWATTHEGAIDLATKVSTALHGTRRYWGSQRTKHVFVRNIRDVFEVYPELIQRQFFGREVTVEIAF